MLKSYTYEQTYRSTMKGILTFDPMQINLGNLSQAPK